MGMGEFNASTARNLAQLAGPIMGLDFSDFLADSRVAVDITPAPQDVIPCTLGISKSGGQICNQMFYMPGTYGDLDLLKNGTLPHADLVVVHDMRGYQLDFDASTATSGMKYDIEEECGVYGNDIAAFQICFQDKDDRIAMRINSCFNSADPTCLSDTNWRHQPGVSSSLKINARLGTVGFSRLNSTIQTYTLANSLQPTNISAAHLSTAFHGFFTGRTREDDEQVPPEWTDITSALLGSLTGGKVDMTPLLVALYFSTGSLMYGTQNIGARNALGLYSLVAKVLWWCSIPMAKSLSESATVGLNLTTTLQGGIDSGGQATYSLATSTYELIVGTNTIVAYGMLGGLVLVFCVLALLFSMGFTSKGMCPPKTSAFPDLDYLRLDFGHVRRISTSEVGLGDDRLVGSFVKLYNEI